MIKNYFKLAFRNLNQQLGYNQINIIGLALGLSCTLFIFTWVFDEVSFDRFHENLNRIYRVEQDQLYNGDAFHVSVTPYPFGEGWKNEIPEIVDAVRIASVGTHLLEYNDRAINVVLAMLIAILIIVLLMDQFRLASFLAEKRTREIGIRKTLGSTNAQIIKLMVKQFTQLVLVAIVIAIPVSWYFLSKWLEDYAYKTELSFTVFLIPGTAVLGFAILTVLLQAWKSSLTSPAVCLKYE